MRIKSPGQNKVKVHWKVCSDIICSWKFHDGIYVIDHQNWNPEAESDRQISEPSGIGIPSSFSIFQALSNSFHRTLSKFSDRVRLCSLVNMMLTFCLMTPLIYFEPLEHPTFLVIFSLVFFFRRLFLFRWFFLSSVDVMAESGCLKKGWKTNGRSWFWPLGSISRINLFGPLLFFLPHLKMI